MTYLDWEGLIRNQRDWWVRQSMIRSLESNKFGQQSYNALLNICMREDDPELARAAAALLFASGGQLQRPYLDCHLSARVLLGSVHVQYRTAAIRQLLSTVSLHMFWAATKLLMIGDVFSERRMGRQRKWQFKPSRGAKQILMLSSSYWTAFAIRYCVKSTKNVEQRLTPLTGTP